MVNFCFSVIEWIGFKSLKFLFYSRSKSSVQKPTQLHFKAFVHFASNFSRILVTFSLEIFCFVVVVSEKIERIVFRENEI